MMKYELAPGYSISRVIKGHWQLAAGHLSQGSLDRQQLIRDMQAFANADITTFDVADIYTGAEEMIGDFIRQSGAAVQVHTKYVPDMGLLSTVSEKDTRTIVERSLKRLGVERLDLVQFHWWDYSVPRYIEVAHHLRTLQREGKIRHIGVTNFNTQKLAELVDSGLDIVSVQTQYSVLDRRPEKSLAAYCLEHGIAMLCYGTLAGGFLSSKFLDHPLSAKNRSHVKYRAVIEDIGGEEKFQELLRVMNGVAQRHGADISDIATAYVLSKQGVGAAIVGAYHQEHLARLLRLNSLRLSAEDISAIESVKLRALEGDAFDLERDAPRHRELMKVNLNSGS